MSQLDLALAAEISPRHLSFVETGRAEPSREMVITLARALEVPPRECNAMLGAAGYAAVYRETSLDRPEMAEMRRALELLLRQHEPFFAVAMDRRWEVVMCNAAYAGFIRAVVGRELAPFRVLPAPRLNILQLLFGRLKAVIENWDETAHAILDRAQRETAASRRLALRRTSRCRSCASNPSTRPTQQPKRSSGAPDAVRTAPRGATGSRRPRTSVGRRPERQKEAVGSTAWALTSLPH